MGPVRLGPGPRRRSVHARRLSCRLEASFRLWQPRARWVFDEDESGKLFLTSSGVAAGGDAALALIARLAGDDEAERIATAAEWTWHRDADSDLFATE